LADTIPDIFDQLKEQRDAAYNAAYEAWRTWKPSEHQMERPPTPSYRGPSELDFRIAKQCVKTRQWHFERLQKKFANRQVVEKTTSLVARGDASKS
jgi:hypothetical protein